MDERLKRIFIQVLNLPRDQVDASINTKNCEKWDSIAHINLILGIEQEFNTMFSPEEIVEMISYQKITSTLMSKGFLQPGADGLGTGGGNGR